MKTMIKFKDILRESKESRNNRISSHSSKLDKAAGIKNIKHDDKENITDYVSGMSYEINDKLIKNKKLDDYEQKIHNSIKGNSSPIGDRHVLYSGTSHDFGEMAKKSKDGVLHSPAHISTSHDFGVAKTFAEGGPDAGDDGFDCHVIRVKMKSSDKVVHVGDSVPHMKHERETIIPSGSKLKYSHSSKHKLEPFLTNTYHIHHFTIHSQE